MDPLLTVNAVCGAVKAVFEYLCTPAGQKQAELWVKNEEKFHQDWDSIGAWIKGLVK